MELFYQIALTSVWWNDDYKDVRRFSSFDEQKTYFDLENIFLNAPRVNFDIKDLLKPRITFKESNKDVFEVLNANYLIVKDNHTSSVQKYFFYFINTIRQDSGDIYIADCKLDVWQTFGFNSQVDIGEGVIERAHLNRWKIKNGKIGFDFSEGSPLLIEEKAVEDSNKLLKNREPLNIPFRTSSLRIARWLQEHILGWVYVFIEADSKSYNIMKFSDTQIPEKADATFVASGLRSKDVSFPYSIIILPIYKRGSSGKIIFHDSLAQTIRISDNFSLFRYYNNGYSFIYSVKMLPVNPLYKYLYNENNELSFNPRLGISVDGNNNLIITSPQYTFVPTNGYMIDVNSGISMITADVFNQYTGHEGALIIGLQGGDGDIAPLQRQILAPTSRDVIYTSKPFQDSLEELKENFNSGDLRRNLILNPKLYGAAYRQIRLNIANQGGESFSYMQLAIDETEREFGLVVDKNIFTARAAIVPEIETLGLSPYTTMLFDSWDYEAVFGTVLTTDLSIAFKNNVYENFLANNKNFWLQNKTKWEAKAFDTLRGSFDDKNLNVVPLIKTGMDIGVDYFELKYQINNMQNAPGLYSSGSGSTSYALSYTTDIAYYLDEYIAPEYILKRDDDYMYMYGYKYGKLDNFNNVVNIRAIFNYVEGIFPSISGNISDEARRILSTSLASGVRFWNRDKPGFDFNLDNLENSVLES